jgi:hypothetical protein
MIPPIFDVSSFQELLDQVQKPFVGDAFAQYPQECIVIDIIEIAFNVSFYPPSDSIHVSFDRFKGRMAASFWSEAVRVFREGWFIDGFQDELEHRTQELIPKTGYT